MYQFLTNNLNEEQKKDMEEIFRLAEQRRAAAGTKSLCILLHSYATTCTELNWSFNDARCWFPIYVLYILIFVESKILALLFNTCPTVCIINTE